METTRAMLTAEQYQALPGSDGTSELVRGEFVRGPSPGWWHGRLASNLDARVRSFVDAHRLGVTFGAETGFLLQRNPDTVRAPDFAFVSASRAAPFAKHPGYAPIAPDLIAEVLSPSDRLSVVREKIADWLAAGTVVALIVDPVHEAVFVHRANAPVEILATGDVFRAHDVLPGFELALADLFAP